MHAHKNNGGRAKPRKAGVQFLHGKRTAPKEIQSQLIERAQAKRQRKAARRLPTA
jgi:hypothetical protein